MESSIQIFRMISREVQLGRAGEYLVLADLSAQGYVAFSADAGSPYDLVVERAGDLWTVQVKTKLQARRRGQNAVPTYRFPPSDQARTGHSAR